MTITIQSEGRRHYLIGNTYPIKDAIRSAGCKRDGDRKAWWTGKYETAEKLVSEVSGSAKPAKGDEKKAPGLEAKVAGRATYKGKSYYLAGKVVRGRTHWDDSCEAVTTRDGAKFLLLSRDGSLEFWAARSEVEVTKRYSKAKTIRSLQEFAAKAKSDGGAGEYCFHMCPVGGFKCCPENGACHDCQ
jgi:hypothetical protein